MSEVEKLRSLLKEAQYWLEYCEEENEDLLSAMKGLADQEDRAETLNRIKLTLAEPALAPWEQRGVADDQMIAALREARVEVERLRDVLKCVEGEFGHRCVLCDRNVGP